MNRDLFDRRLRALRRDRAARLGPELFLLDRAFNECLDRLHDIPRRFERALLLGCPSPDWRDRVKSVAYDVTVMDPGALFASRSDGQQIEEDRQDFGNQQFDLCIAVGTLDTVNDLPLALQKITMALTHDSPLIGAIAGGNSLPALRASLIAAGRSEGRVVARSHPRIDATSLARLLQASGLAMPVVDVDRVAINYSSLAAVVRDLRAMGATSVLAQQAPAFSKSELQAAANEFLQMGNEGRTEETVEILHFLAWRQ